MFFFSWLDNLRGFSPLHCRGFEIHSDTPHSVGLLWRSDRPIAETSTLLHKALTRMTSNLQTHALDGVATEIGKYGSKIKQCLDRPLGLQEVKAPIIPK